MNDNSVRIFRRQGSLNTFLSLSVCLSVSSSNLEPLSYSGSYLEVMRTIELVQIQIDSGYSFIKSTTKLCNNVYGCWSCV